MTTDSFHPGSAALISLVLNTSFYVPLVHLSSSISIPEPCGPASLVDCGLNRVFVAPVVQLVSRVVSHITVVAFKLESS